MGSDLEDRHIAEMQTQIVDLQHELDLVGEQNEQRRQELVERILGLTTALLDHEDAVVVATQAAAAAAEERRREESRDDLQRWARPLALAAAGVGTVIGVAVGLVGWMRPWTIALFAALALLGVVVAFEPIRADWEAISLRRMAVVGLGASAALLGLFAVPDLPVWIHVVFGAAAVASGVGAGVLTGAAADQSGHGAPPASGGPA